ncbi:hypothetical protein [Aliifodinibius sp. S!AR15-10]|uniref:hypothetical protein n=1 Tax=Aliifodinibius sp. S!AR15-10 TaxID=2950437 RepID=UPI002870777B|nr:hypothetical protein [Aliifodinibius sp. S!AR15-10]
MQRVKGQWFKDHRIIQEHGEMPKCSVERGENHVFKLDFQSTGSPFRTDTRSLELLLVSLSKLPEAGDKLELPSDQVDICLLSGTQVVTFKAYEAEGWIRLSSIGNHKLEGEMKLSFSNELKYEGIDKQKQVATTFTLRESETSD